MCALNLKRTKNLNVVVLKRKWRSFKEQSLSSFMTSILPKVRHSWSIQKHPGGKISFGTTSWNSFLSLKRHFHVVDNDNLKNATKWKTQLISTNVWMKVWCIFEFCTQRLVLVIQWYHKTTTTTPKWLLLGSQSIIVRKYGLLWNWRTSLYLQIYKSGK